MPGARGVASTPLSGFNLGRAGYRHVAQKRSERQVGTGVLGVALHENMDQELALVFIDDGALVYAFMLGDGVN